MSTTVAKRIPISAAKKVADEQNCRQIILLAWDGELTHIVTYGKTTEDCAQAATGGNLLKEKWGWPECNDQPSRVKKLTAEVEELRKELAEARDSIKSSGEYPETFTLAECIESLIAQKESAENSCKELAVQLEAMLPLAKRQPRSSEDLREITEAESALAKYLDMKGEIK